MNPARSDATGSSRTNLTVQAGNEHDVRQDPGAGKSQPARQSIPTVSVDSDRQTTGQPAPFFPPQQELTSQFIPGASPGQLSSSQPVLRGLESAESAHRSGNLQTDVPGSLALQEPGPTLCEQASRVAGRPSLEQGSDSAVLQAASDKEYRSKLSAWVEFADLFGRAVNQKARKRINAYLEKPAEQRKVMNLSNSRLSTLPPLPPDLEALDVSKNDLTALPEHLPQGLQQLKVGNNRLTALPERLPQGLQQLDVSDNQLTVLPKHLPPGLQDLHVARNQLTALPEHLPQDLQQLYVGANLLTALPEHMPQGLQELYVAGNKLTVLPEHMPQGLQYLNVGFSQLTALPKHLPQGLQMLRADRSKLTALPEHLPQGLQKLYVGQTKLTALPKHLPQNLKFLSVEGCGLNSNALVGLMRSNISITELDVDRLDIDANAKQELDAELVNNREHPARLIKAAVTLDLLTRFGLTTSDQTGTLIKRDSTPHPVAGRLPEQPIPTELHDVLAANFPKDVLAVLAGMVDGAVQ